MHRIPALIPARSFALISWALIMGACASVPPEVKNARTLLARGDYQDAERAAMEAQRKYPDHPELWRVRIESAHRQGQARRATELYRTWHSKRGAHDSKLLARLALTTLWQGLRVPSTQIRVDTILAIERLEVEKLANDVDALMTSDSDIVAAAAATALLRGRPGAPRIATQILVSEDPQARAIAVAGIGRKIGERARVDLRFSLRDGDPRVRIAGIEAIAPMGHPDDTDRLIALAASDPDTDVRARALASLTSARTGARAVGVRALQDPALSVRVAAVGLLKRLDDRESLERIARTSADATAVHALAALGDPTRPAAAQVVSRAFAQPDLADDWAQRAALAEAVGRVLPRADAIARLRVLCGDPDGRVRVAAALALTELDASQGVDVLSAACTDQAAETRSAAIAAHKRLRVYSAGLISALADDSALIRVQAAEAVMWAAR